MQEINTGNQKQRSVLTNLREKFLFSFRAFLAKFKNIKFLIPLVLLILALNSFIIFRINYSEDFKLVYRYERPTIVLGSQDYLELYRFHDYLQYTDKNVVSVLTANTETKSKENKDILLGINSGVEEIALGDKADINTKINRIDKNNFQIEREINFKDSVNLSEIDAIYMELIVGGDKIYFTQSDNSLNFGECKLQVNKLDSMNAKYNEKDRVITYSTSVNNQKSIKFIINFNLNCG